MIIAERLRSQRDTMQRVKDIWGRSLFGKIAIGCLSLIVFVCLCSLASTAITPRAAATPTNEPTPPQRNAGISTTADATSTIESPTATAKPSSTPEVVTTTPSQTVSIRVEVTPSPTVKPMQATATPEPTAKPTEPHPTQVPTAKPTQLPPSPVPTVQPTLVPPTALPTVLPTLAPATAVPTAVPTQVMPTAVPGVAKVLIAAISRKTEPEWIVIKNTGDAAQDMTGWVIVSVKGNQRFGFPAGFVLGPGASVTVQSAEGSVNNPPAILLWTTANMWNNDGDPAQLLDAQGNVVSST